MPIFRSPNDLLSNRTMFAIRYLRRFFNASNRYGRLVRGSFGRLGLGGGEGFAPLPRFGGNRGFERLAELLLLSDNARGGLDVATL